MVNGIPEDLDFIMLDEYQTTFWRYQHVSSTCLATIESIYYFYKELIDEKGKRQAVCQEKESPSTNQIHFNIDDLLFFYALQYTMIKKYTKEKGKKKETIVRFD